MIKRISELKILQELFEKEKEQNSKAEKLAIEDLKFEFSRIRQKLEIQEKLLLGNIKQTFDKRNEFVSLLSNKLFELISFSSSLLDSKIIECKGKKSNKNIYLDFFDKAYSHISDNANIIRKELEQLSMIQRGNIKNYDHICKAISSIDLIKQRPIIRSKFGNLR